MSKSRRKAISMLYFAGFIIIPFLDGLLLHLTNYVDLTLSILYVVGGLELMSMLFVGASSEQTFSFPFPFDSVSNAVPKVFERNRWRLWGKVVRTDHVLSSYVAKIGWSRWAGRMTVNLYRLDETTTKVHVLYESKGFIDLGSARRVTDLFLRILYGVVSGADSYTMRRLWWRL